MGIDVSPRKQVSHNPSHQRRVVTSTTKNPSVTFIEKVRVIGILKRVRDTDRKDGNPLIHALKGAMGYYIELDDVVSISKNVNVIIKKVIRQFKPEIIVPVPSSSKINHMLARRLARAYENKPRIEDCLRKATIAEVLQRLPQVNAVDRKLRREFTSELDNLERGDPNSPFQMKLVDRSVRHLFDPISLNFIPAGWTSNEKILFVDDVFSTGTSLMSSINAFGIPFPAPQIAAAVLLSPMQV